MAKRHRHVPAYRLHKPSGQARVIVNREHIYLGRYGTPESLEKYHRIVADLASLNTRPVDPAALSPNGFDFSVGELILTFWNFASCHYIKDGRPTDELNGIRAALRPVRRLYGHTAARHFGPKALKNVRQSMIDTDHSRKYINDSVNRVRRMLKWAASEEMLPVSVYQALQTVSGLKAGRSAAREPEPIKPVEEAVVKATLPHVLSQVAAMIQVQYLTGARPCEVCILRPRDITFKDNRVWIYRPASHKTQHLGRERWLVLGPKAQEVLRPWLDRAPEAYCFSPAEAVAHFHNGRGTRCQLKNKPGERYRTDSYRTAIQRACRKNGIPVWSPNQLRHSRATAIRAQFGIQGAQAVLGHSEPNTTAIYAERDFALVAKIMRQVG